ncbi:MAG TPA: sigma 54-interacting transcriptional regulator [Terriglobales bacterium]|nr:sigma 54-interacting transcriptional regulator [Terriglobales bacterium]
MTLEKTNPQPPVAREDSGADSLPVAGGAMGSFAIFYADLEGNITGCNGVAVRVFGRTPAKHRTLAAAISGENDREQSQLQKAMLDTVVRDGQYRNLWRCRGTSDQGFTVELFATLLRDGDAAPSGMVVFIGGTEDKSCRSMPAQIAGQGDGVVHTVSRQLDGVSLIVASPAMHHFMGMVDRVAGHTESVLILGETGTGKELIARTIHQSSLRRGRPWVDINCAALPENLVESELFGYEKGAFTGADSSKPGLFELADKGSLFLDEIGELQIQTQVKLLRVLDGYPFYRLGGHRKITVDVRVVAATNQDLDAAVSAGRFRKDLFHRLGQFQLRVPPLRERPEDIAALAEHFLTLKKPGSWFAPDSISALLAHPWPGNVRELRNLIARVAVESSHPEIQKSQIRDALIGNPMAQRQSASLPVGNLDSMEEQMIIHALERSGGLRNQAAEQLGISRRTLSRKLKEYNITVNPGERGHSLGFISLEQQKFFRARVQLPVVLKNQHGEEVPVQGVNLSIGGIGLDGLKEPMRFSGLLDVSFPLPESDIMFQAKARIVWLGSEGRVGLRFAVIDPALFEQLQRWTNKKMKDEGWELPTRS